MADTDPARQDPATRSFDRQFVIVGGGILLVLALMAWLPDITPPVAPGLISDLAHARVLGVLPATDQSAPIATIQYVDGARAGQQDQAQVEGPSGQLQLPDYEPGDDVIVAIDTNPDGTQTASIIDRWRLPLLRNLVGAFAIVTILVAGWRGIRALVSLSLTVVLAVKLLIPALLAGWNPVALAISLGTLITVATLVLTQGLNRQVLAAVLGTMVGLLVTGILAIVVTKAAQFTISQGSEQITFLQQLTQGQIDLSGLLLAAVIFGGLGVLNDVAISQAATVDELRSVSPRMPRLELYRRTMNVGIAHLGATINTLVFAYLGAALPLLVVLAIQVESFNLTVNEEIIAVEVVRTLVGSIGILLAVPATTAIAAWFAPAQDARQPIPAIVEEPLPAGPSVRVRLRRRAPATTPSETPSATAPPAAPPSTPPASAE